MTITKKYFITFTFLFCLFLAGCTSSEKMEKLYMDNEKSFNDFVIEFNKQNQVNNIVISVNNKTCQIINSWGRCPTTETKWSKETGKVEGGVYEKTYLNTIEEVLDSEMISKDKYEKISQFLKKHNLTALGKDNDQIEFEDGLTGLRYYSSLNNEFLEDEEFLMVKKINDNWYVYARDWN